MDDEQGNRSTPQNAVGSSSAVTLDGPEPTQAALAWYSAQFNRHATDSALEATGRAYLPSLNEERRLYRTIVPPSGAEWSPREKDLFFAALVRHSRLRPDLIARDVPGKSEAEVLWYLEELDRQSRQLRRTDGRVHGFRDRLGRWGVHRRRWIRGVAPAAREVAPSWIEQEDKLSDALLRAVERDLAEVRAKRWVEARQAEKDELIDEAFERSGAKYRNRWRGEKELLASLEQRWSVQDWGDPLDAAKMEEIDALLARPPSFPEASALEAGQTGKVIPEPSSTVSREPSTLPSSRPSTPDRTSAIAAPLGSERSGSKLSKIAADRALKDRIMAIPRSERTTEQRKALGVVLNRERMRIRTRTQKLLADGWTESQIDAAGGADAIIDKRLEEKEAATRGSGVEMNLSGDDLTASPNTTPRKRKRRRSVAAVKEEDVEEPTEALAETDFEVKKREWRLRLERYIIEEKLDIFNYSRMTELARLVAQRDDDVPALSWDIVERLRDHLMAYLVPLMYQIITLAETRSTQIVDRIPPEDPQRSRSREATAVLDDKALDADKASAQITVNDVMLVLASTGRPHPGEEIRRFWRRQIVKSDTEAPLVEDDKEDKDKEEESGRDEGDDDANELPSADEGDPVETSNPHVSGRKLWKPSLRRTDWPKSVLPPDDMPWRLMPSVRSEVPAPLPGDRSLSRRSSTSLPRRPRSNAVSRATSVTGSPLPSNYVPSEDETLPSEAETTLTDEEEMKRDDLLDRVDALWDMVLQEELSAQSARRPLDADRPGTPTQLKHKKGTKRKRGAAESSTGDEQVRDYDDPWRGNLHFKRLEAADRQRNRSKSRSATGGGPDESDADESDEDELWSPLERAEAGRDRYTRRLLRISKKRRDRHSRLYQQSRFAALRLRGRAPDSAWYVSSDDDSEPDADTGAVPATGSVKRGLPRRTTADPLGDDEAETSEEEVSWAGGSDRESLPGDDAEEPAMLEDEEGQPEYQLSSGSEYPGSENES